MESSSKASKVRFNPNSIEGGCFCCGEPNHWMKDCRFKNYRCVKGNLQHKMKFGTSSTDLNKGRKFLSCFGQNGCKGFKWLDELIVEELQQTAMKKDEEELKKEELKNEDDDLLHLKISINKNIEMCASGSVVAVSKLVKLMSKVEM
ncbi:hypothetical protein FRX31_019976 [Thalictrum thalictroides]|uniref:Uncharacterized protein n=1 Tax=Thalictrum thalictroides TaxID=46969 RepID=A0A7J6W0G9_THATH|nr:hypothetical protein FRX31_019976 [Thalictrum thalictroides]